MERCAAALIELCTLSSAVEKMYLEKVYVENVYVD